MMRRARLISVLTIVLAGAIGVISSTQTWLVVHLHDDAADALEVAGNIAVAVLAPLSLAAIAVGAALSLVGRIARYVLGALTLLLAGSLLTLAVSTATQPPQSAYARTVTEATGIDGEQSVAALVSSVDVTPWPWLAAVAFALLFAAGLLVLVSAGRWSTGGRKYSTGGRRAGVPGAPLDAVDSWDDLSRGDDPTN